MFLVLGSNSFTGSNFIRKALLEGYCVVGVSRSKQLNDAFLAYTWIPKSLLKNYRFFQLDINSDTSKIIDLVVSENPEYIINFCAQGMVAESWQNPEDWYTTNLVSQSVFVNAIKSVSSIRKYVQVTTPEVYGNTDDWVIENFSFSPSTPYAISRAACDTHLKCLNEYYDFPVVFTRSSNVYGPGQQLYRIIPKSIYSERTGSQMELHGAGRSRRSFVYVDDVVRATLQIALSGIPGETYHISTRELVSIRELVELVFEKLGASFDALVNLAPERVGKDDSYSLDSNKVRQLFDWSDEVALGSGIEETIIWFDKHSQYLAEQSAHYEHRK